MGMYPNIKPPDATTLLIARGASGAADGSREPSQASTTSRRARPQTAFTAAPTANDVLSVKENANPETRAYSAPAARRYAAVARMPPSMDSSSMTLYPQAGSVNCAYANVVNVTSDVGGSRYANRNSAHVAARGVKHGANGARNARVAERVLAVEKHVFFNSVRRRREENREARRARLMSSAVVSSASSSSSKPPMSSSSPRFGQTASASRRASYAPSRARRRVVFTQKAFGSGTAQAAAAAARAKTPASAMTILASVSLSKGMESAVAVKLPADLTSMPALCTRMAFFESPPLSCASAPSAPVSQIAKTTTEETPAAYSAGIESTRA